MERRITEDKQFNLDELIDEFKKLYESSCAYFERLGKDIQKKSDGDFILVWKRTHIDFEKLDKIKQNIVNQLNHEYSFLFNEAFRFAKYSPLLTSADEFELKINARKMKAALFLKRYEYFEQEVIHDEGDYKGVFPAQQAEENTTPFQSKTLLDSCYNKILKTFELFARTPVDNSNNTQQFVSPTDPGISKIKQNTAFIMMWIDKNNPHLDDVKDTIKDVFSSFGIRAVRADEIEHEDVITNRILSEIANSEFLIADLTGERQSVYYEVGYAHALGRRVILFKTKGSNLHFDLKMHNCPEYENLGDLKRRLTKRLEALTNKSPSL